MLFNSNVFLIFFAGFLLAYWLVRGSLTSRNYLIVLSSYFFYGWWDYRFLALLLFSSALDYAAGLGIERSAHPIRRKAWLMASLTGNLGVLFFFKYFDFFRESLEVLLQTLGVAPQWRSFYIVLPVGISFYTFQSLSYTIDVYRGQTRATTQFVQFLAYVSFFPQLVAGPIERASHLLQQFGRTLRITLQDLEIGLWLMLWGMFKKVALADNLAPLVEMTLDHSAPTAPLVLMGTVAFALQIYCDFSGYSDIARGAARLLGIDLMINFNLPYFATNLRDFWRRWHISLSTWLRDYLYVSLGGNRRGAHRTYFNLFLTMLLGGLWHGAALNFLLWGVWHGMGLAVNRRWQEWNHGRFRLPAAAGWLITALFLLYGWLLFRAQTPERLLALHAALLVFEWPVWWKSCLQNLLVLAAPLILMQIWQFRTGNPLVALGLPWLAKSLLQGILLVGILLFWGEAEAPFIYFQF